MISSTARPTGRLLRVLGVGFGLAVTIGNTIGGGILKVPGEVAANVANEAVFLGIWVVGGLYALLGAISLAELGAMMPRSGGQYVFARNGIGEYAGFVVGWNDWLSTAGSVAVVAMVLAESFGGLVPAAADRQPLVAMSVIALFTALVWRGVRVGAGAQAITSTLKALVFVALIAACFLVTPREQVPVIERVGTVAPLLGVVLALQGVIYAYDGWTGVLYFSEEVRDPGRDIPRSMFGGVISVIVIYLLVNIAFLHVLPMEALPGGETAAAKVARTLFGGRGDLLVNIVIVVALLSTVNALLPMAARILFAMGSDGLFSRVATRVNPGGTPTVALALSAAVALLFVATGTFNAVIGVLSVFFVANYLLSFVALLLLRRRLPDAPRPYRAWGYPWTTILAIVGSLAFLVAAIKADSQTALLTGALVAAGVPVYLLIRRARRAA